MRPVPEEREQGLNSERRTFGNRTGPSVRQGPSQPRRGAAPRDNRPLHRDTTNDSCIETAVCYLPLNKNWKLLWRCVILFCVLLSIFVKHVCTLCRCVRMTVTTQVKASTIKQFTQVYNIFACVHSNHIRKLKPLQIHKGGFPAAPAGILHGTASTAEPAMLSSMFAVISIQRAEL
ncbi:hypothetical protein CEXT_598081 [Caerostris extrusa]|uniref:Uncharacterized protein n=1 Tax=Caerostris extrusa TaxID=172846 RepID=A0AAV4NQY9_CAEEX|nr:hypothetical protein CEXT_598081 [Caerostris extrusa]